MGVTARLDNFPRRHTWLGFPVAMVYIHRHTQPNSTDQPRTEVQIQAGTVATIPSGAPTRAAPDRPSRTDRADHQGLDPPPGRRMGPSLAGRGPRRGRAFTPVSRLFRLRWTRAPASTRSDDSKALPGDGPARLRLSNIDRLTDLRSRSRCCFGWACRGRRRNPGRGAVRGLRAAGGPTRRSAGAGR